MLSPGDRIGDYEIVRPLRAGGMATLYLGRRVGPAGFARLVAIKVIHPHLGADKVFVQMFLDEARLSARIQHPNVVHVEELGEDSARRMYYLVMEYVHGCSLSQLLNVLAQHQRALSPPMAAYIALCVTDGLHAAHETRDDKGELLGVVHRDVSPDNVLLATSGAVKLIDFGIAKARGRTAHTATGSIRGKIRYMSPEQAWGKGFDRRADIYALGVVLWEMLTTRRLFRADNDFALLEEVRRPKTVAPSHFVAEVPKALDDVVLHALAPDAEDRFQTAQEIRRAIVNSFPEALKLDPSDLAELLAAVGQIESTIPGRTPGQSLVLASLALDTLAELKVPNEGFVELTMEQQSDVLASWTRTASEHTPTDTQVGVLAAGVDDKTHATPMTATSPTPIAAPPDRTARIAAAVTGVALAVALAAAGWMLSGGSTATTGPREPSRSAAARPVSATKNGGTTAAVGSFVHGLDAGSTPDGGALTPPEDSGARSGSPSATKRTPRGRQMPPEGTRPPATNPLIRGTGNRADAGPNKLGPYVPTINFGSPR